MLTVVLTLSLLLSPLLLADIVFARRGGGAGRAGSIDINLDLNPMNAASFSFVIVWAIAAFLQLSSVCRLLQQIDTSSAPQLKVLYNVPLSALALGIGLLIPGYSMEAVYIAHDRSENFSTPLPNAFYVMTDFLQSFSQWVIIAALVLFMDRLWVHINPFVTSDGVSPTRPSSLTLLAKRCIDGTLVALALIFLIISDTMYGALLHQTSLVTPSQVNSWYAVRHVMAAWYILILVDVVITGAILFAKRKKIADAAGSPTLNGSIWIPFQIIVALEALASLLFEIILYLPAQYNLNFDSVFLSSYIVLPFPYVTLIWIWIRMGHQELAHIHVGESGIDDHPPYADEGGKSD